MRLRIRLLVVTLALGLMGTGCGTVRPWEREQLSRLEHHAGRGGGARAYEGHLWSVREGAAGGTGAPGGGCGCY